MPLSCLFFTRFLHATIYIPFKCKQPLKTISKLNIYLTDIRKWIITNKLKIQKTNLLYFHFKNIDKIKNLLSYDACSTIIHALISCRLHYCNYILYNVPKSKTDRLQRLQNQCARILTKSPRTEHTTTVLKNLYWLKIKD